MTRRLLLLPVLLPVLLGVAACAPTGEPAQAAASAAAPSPSPDLSEPLVGGWPPVPPEGIAHTPHDNPDRDLGRATVSLRDVDAGVRALPADNLAQAREAAAVIVSECPYNRSMVQLAVLSRQVLARHDDPALAPLKQSIDLQVSVFEQLGVASLPLPRVGAYLHPGLAGLTTAAQLRASDDPVGATRLLTDQIEGLVRAYDPATKARIEQAGAVLSRATQDQWVLKGPMLAQRDELTRLVATTSDPALKADLAALEGIITDVMAMYC